MDDPCFVKVDDNHNDLHADFNDLPMAQFLSIEIQKLIQVHINKLNVIFSWLLFMNVVIKEVIFPAVSVDVLKDVDFMNEPVT